MVVVVVVVVVVLVLPVGTGENKATNSASVRGSKRTAPRPNAHKRARTNTHLARFLDQPHVELTGIQAR